MKKPTYYSSSPSNQRLHEVFLNNPGLLGELADAAICNNIAADLYRLRKKAGLTQGQLAQVLGVKQSNISRWETLGYQGYKVKVLSRIVRALNGKLSIKITPQTTYSYSLRFSAPLALDTHETDITTDSIHIAWTPSNQKGYIKYGNLS